jgi:hypothetical protein
MSAKLIHRANKVNNRGDASALCYLTPRPINLRVASWTIRDEAVTCPKCKALMTDLAIAATQPPPTGE